MIPRIPITDKRFQYRNSACTDVRITFAEARKRMEAEQKLRQVINMKRKERA